MCGVVVAVLAGEVEVVLDDEEILGVAVLSGLREVERTGDDGAVVDKDNLVVGDGVAVVNEGGDTLVKEEVEFAVVLGLLRFVENDLAVDATFFGFEDGLGDGGGGERIGLNADVFFGVANFLDDSVGASAIWGKEHVDSWLGGRLGRRGGCDE